MPLSRADFWQLYPEFADKDRFPIVALDMYLAEAYRELNAQRFGAGLDFAAGLFVAHYLALRSRDAMAAASGGAIGQAQGPIASKTVDKVSVSYDTGATADPRAGAWNATVYGQQLWARMKAVGSGPIYRVPRR